MPTIRKALLRGLVLPVVLAVLSCHAALASQVSVQPIQMHFTKPGQSSVLTLSNQSDAPVRLQITGFAWKQNTDGTMALTQTNDLVYFPTLVTIPPRETRSVRVAVTAPPANVEQSYRIFVEELPSLESQLSPNGGPSVFVRTKFGIPLFIDALQAVQNPQITGGSVRSGSLSFDVTNQGTEHFVIRKASLTAYADDKALYVRDLGGWYVLPGGERSYVVPLRNCAELKTVKVHVETTAGTLDKTLNFAQDCRR